MGPSTVWPTRMWYCTVNPAFTGELPTQLMSAHFQFARSPRRLVRHAAWLVLVALPLCGEARPVRVYEVDVAGQSAAALQDAMREALVRATGHGEAASDPVFATIVQNARQYVQTYTTGPQGEPQVVFDGTAVERAINAAGRAVWRTDRPFTLIVLYPPPDRQTEDSAQTELEGEAEHRGLPVSLLPIPVVDAKGAPLGREAILETAQRYGADDVLVGRSDGAPAGQWRWTLYTDFNTPSWTGPLTAGIDGAVDTLAPPVGAPPAADDADTHVEVQGVSGLNEYANVESMLESVPGVRRGQVAEVQPNQVTFDLDMRGGAAALNRALAGSPLVPTGTQNGVVIYQYHPQSSN